MSGAAISNVPVRVPARIAAKVPAATQALPPSSSSRPSRFGRMAYLTGPNSADCSPVRNSTANSRPSEFQAKPSQASAISSISASFTARTSRWRG